MERSTVKNSNVKSSSCSLVAAPKKRKRDSAGSRQIENVAMDYPFYCSFIKFSYCCYTFIYGKIWLCRKTSILFIRHPLHLIIMRIIILKNKELKLGAISYPTPVYLEELSPIPALAAGD